MVILLSPKIIYTHDPMPFSFHNQACILTERGPDNLFYPGPSKATRSPSFPQPILERGFWELDKSYPGRWDLMLFFKEGVNQGFLRSIWKCFLF